MLLTVVHRLYVSAAGRNLGVEALPAELIIDRCFAHGARPYGQTRPEGPQHAGMTINTTARSSSRRSGDQAALGCSPMGGVLVAFLRDRGTRGAMPRKRQTAFTYRLSGASRRCRSSVSVAAPCFQALLTRERARPKSRWSSPSRPEPDTASTRLSSPIAMTSSGPVWSTA